MEEVIHINIKDLEQPLFKEQPEYVHTFSVQPKPDWNEEENSFFENISNAKTIIVWTS